MQSAEKFNIGVSAKLLSDDGSPAMEELDLSLLTDNPHVEVSRLPDVDTGDLLHSHVENLDAAILFLEKITDKTFAPQQRLSLLARYGVGFDTLDIGACTAADVAVAIAPSGVRRPVATSVIALLLALTLRIPEKDSLTRSIPDGWLKKTEYNGVGLVGRTLGGIGLGNIGSEVFRLVAPFDMNLIAHDPYVDKAHAASLGVKLVSLDEVFSEADVLTLNCPLSDETRHLVNAARLSQMKESAFLINTARGPVVDEPALIAALQNGELCGAGLDTFEQEPPAPDNPLLAMNNVILSPHALCFTDQCMGGLWEADAKACLSVMIGRSPETLVNPEVMTRSIYADKLSRYAGSFRQSVPG